MKGKQKIMKKKHNRLKINNIIKEYLLNNLKEYAIITLFFLIGIFLGIIFINNSNEYQKEEINKYICTYIENLKESKNINNLEVLKNDIKNNVILFLILWFSGTTIIGLPVVIGVITYRGFCLGYTISACTYVLGTWKAIGFTTLSMMLHNILFIPILLSIGVSGIKLYKKIVKDKKKDNIKIAVIKHTIFSIFLFILVIITSLIKVCISGELVDYFIKYF